MLSYVPIAVVAAAIVLLIWANERYNLFSSDAFPSKTARVAAYAWLSTFALFLTAIVVASSRAPVSKSELKEVSFWSLFTLHSVLLVFLLGWWLLANRPPLGRFLNLLPGDRLRDVMLGLAVGVGGWAITMALALAVGLILQSLKLVPEDLQPSPVIPWMAALPLWQKITIIFSAMTVEEFFFRGWLQKRLGLVLSTIAFVIAHAGYGQPLMMIGILIVSVIIGITFYRTKNLLPCIIAHGVFDAIQLLVLVPLAVKFTGIG